MIDGDRTNLASFLGHFLVYLMVMIFDSRLTTHDTPKMPREHDTDSKAKYHAKHVNQAVRHGRNVMRPFLLIELL